MSRSRFFTAIGSSISCENERHLLLTSSQQFNTYDQYRLQRRCRRRPLLRSSVSYCASNGAADAPLTRSIPSFHQTTRLLYVIRCNCDVRSLLNTRQATIQQQKKRVLIFQRQRCFTSLLFAFVPLALSRRDLWWMHGWSLTDVNLFLSQRPDDDDETYDDSARNVGEQNKLHFNLCRVNGH